MSCFKYFIIKVCNSKSKPKILSEIKQVNQKLPSFKNKKNTKIYYIFLVAVRFLGDKL